MTSLAANVAKSPPYSFMDMLRLSQTMAPSIILPTGGFLMELYILRYGKRGDAAFLEKRSTRIKPSQMDQLVRRYGFPFWFHLSNLNTFHRGNGTHIRSFCSRGCQIFVLLDDDDGIPWSK